MFLNIYFIQMVTFPYSTYICRDCSQTFCGLTVQVQFLCFFDSIGYLGNKDIQLIPGSYVRVCLFSEVWDYEVIGSENRHTWVRGKL